MNIEVVRNAFLWCAVIDYTLLILWFVLFLFPHEWIYGITSKAFKVPREDFDRINFTGMVYFKMAVIVFNLVPYLALRFVG